MCWLRNDSGTRDLLLVRRDILSICSQFARAGSVVPTAPFGTLLHLRPLLCTTFDATVDELSGLVKEYKEREAQAILDRLAKRGRTKHAGTSNGDTTALGAGRTAPSCSSSWPFLRYSKRTRYAPANRMARGTTRPRAPSSNRRTNHAMHHLPSADAIFAHSCTVRARSDDGECMRSAYATSTST